MLAHSINNNKDEPDVCDDEVLSYADICKKYIVDVEGLSGVEISNAQEYRSRDNRMSPVEESLDEDKQDSLEEENHKKEDSLQERSLDNLDFQEKIIPQTPLVQRDLMGLQPGDIEHAVLTLQTSLCG